MLLIIPPQSSDDLESGNIHIFSETNPDLPHLEKNREKNRHNDNNENNHKNNHNNHNNNHNNNKHREKKRSDYWPEHPFNLAADEESLWRSVIIQAIFDAVAIGKKARTIRRKNEAMAWLTENSEDFIDVCLLAGLDHNYVRKYAKKALLNTKSWRTEPGHSKRYLKRKQARENRKQALKNNSLKNNSLKNNALKEEQAATIILNFHTFNNERNNI